ncbi:hypothetical protein LCGC14_1941550 [marine sediment metagenome]|uniref:Uncharacterized protein n=1 Tax=marine sediment metagenome TaxID=412755 RepID=A0A0F9IHF8_9ZZZZ
MVRIVAYYLTIFLKGDMKDLRKFYWDVKFKRFKNTIKDSNEMIKTKVKEFRKLKKEIVRQKKLSQKIDRNTYASNEISERLEYFDNKIENLIYKLKSYSSKEC